MPTYTRAEWDEMQALMRASIEEAGPGEDMRETASGKAAIKKYGDRMRARGTTFVERPD